MAKIKPKLSKKPKSQKSDWEIIPEAQEGKITQSDIPTYYGGSLPEVTITATSPKSFSDFGKRYINKLSKDYSGSLGSSLFELPIASVLNLPQAATTYLLSDNKSLLPSEAIGLDEEKDFWKAFALNTLADPSLFFGTEALSGAKNLKRLQNLEKGAINAVNDYSKSLKNTKSIIKGYQANKNPLLSTSQNESLLKNIRNIGMSLKDENDLYDPKMLQSVLERAKGLTEEQFKTLTGFGKNEIEERIKKIGSGELKKPNVEESIRSTASQSRPSREEMIRGMQEDAVRRRAERDPRITERLIELSNPTGWQTLTTEITNPSIFNRPTDLNTTFISRNYLRDSNNLIDKLNEVLTTKLAKKLGLEEKSSPESLDFLVSGISAREGEKSVKRKLLNAIKTLDQAPKGSTFIPSSSLSTDSYPLSYKLLPKFIKENKVDLGFTGMKYLNTMGFSQQLGLPKEINIKEINSVIKEINDLSGKKFPYARLENGEIKAPEIFATRKQKGGKIINDNMGQWKYPGEITKINSPNITMQGVNYPVLGVSDTNDVQMMYPNQDYKFKGSSVTEYPMMQPGGKTTRPPLEISDPREYARRAQAYEDSLDLYTTNRDRLAQLERESKYATNMFGVMGLYNNGLLSEHYTYLPPDQVTHNQYPLTNVPSNYENGNDRTYWGFENRRSDVSINPITYHGFDRRFRQNVIRGTNQTFNLPGQNDLHEYAGIWQFPQPVQPIIYQPEKNQESQKPKSETRNVLTPEFETVRRKKDKIELLEPKTAQLQSSPINQELNLIPFAKGTYYTRPRQRQEEGYGKLTDYYNREGIKIGTYEEGGELPEAGSGYKVIRSSERKGKTHKVIGPDGTVKFFGDSKLGQHPKDPARKKAFYARHAKNLKKNPYFRAFARKTWEEGGMLPDLMEMAAGGQFLTVGGEYHRIYKNADGDIMVNHPKEDKGKWDTINLTDKAGAKTVADGVAATKKWHRENPYAFGGNVILEKYQQGGNTWEIVPDTEWEII